VSPTSLSYGQPLHLTTSATARAQIPNGWVLAMDGATIGTGGGYPDTFPVAAPEALGLHTLALSANGSGALVATATFTVVASNPAWPIPGGLAVSPNPASAGTTLHVTTSTDARSALESSWLLRLDGQTIADGGGIPDVVPVTAPSTLGTHTLSVYYMPPIGGIDFTRPVAVATFTVQ
jgi:hypothetical protein